MHILILIIEFQFWKDEKVKYFFWVLLHVTDMALLTQNSNSTNDFGLFRHIELIPRRTGNQKCVYPLLSFLFGKVYMVNCLWGYPQTSPLPLPRRNSLWTALNINRYLWAWHATHLEWKQLPKCKLIWMPAMQLFFPLNIIQNYAPLCNFPKLTS